MAVSEIKMELELDTKKAREEIEFLKKEVDKLARKLSFFGLLIAKIQARFAKKENEKLRQG